MRNILAVSIDITNQNVGIHDNAISITWESLTEQSTDDVLFNLVFSATQTGKLKESVNMNSSITKAEIYKGSDIEVMNLELSIQDNLPSVVVLNQNDPNPFVDQTVISFVLPQASDATLSIFNVDGKELKKITGNFVKGLNEVIVKRDDMDMAGGIVYYQLQVGDFTDTKRMMVVQ